MLILGNILLLTFLKIKILQQIILWLKIIQNIFKKIHEDDYNGESSCTQNFLDNLKQYIHKHEYTVLIIYKIL